jgi:DUF917 family protein
LRRLGPENLEDLIRGCAVLGTGGGGSPSRGITAIRRALKRGAPVQLIKVEELPDEAAVATPYVVGSVPPDEEGDGAPWETLGLNAMEGLEETVARRFDAVVPIEVGGYNTAVAACVAAARDIPLVDADPAGRSVPGVEHTTYFLCGVPITPMCLSTGMGDVVVIRKVADDHRAEAIARALAVASRGSVGVADHPATVETMRDSVIPGTLTRALSIGKAVRQSSARGEDPVAAVVQAGDGCLLFAGVIAGAQWRVKGGFTMGELEIDGRGGDLGRAYLVRFKNEHYGAWLDGTLDVTVPDLLAILDSQTGAAITNPNFRDGTAVSVVGFAAAPIWRTPRGLALFGPRASGIDAEYRPLEVAERLRGRRS